MRWSLRRVERWRHWRPRVPLISYVAFVGIPSVLLVYVGFRSYQQQHTLLEQTTRTNLTLAGERLATDFERQALGTVQSLVRDTDLMRISQRVHESMTPVECERVRQNFEQAFALASPSVLEALFVLQGGRLLYPIFSKQLDSDLALTIARKRQLAIARMLQTAGPFFDASDLLPGNVYPLAFPEAQAQLFYTPAPGGPERLVFVLMNNAFAADLLSGAPYRTGIKQPTHFVALGTAGGDLQIRLPMLFPYWRIAMFTDGPIQAAYQRWLFPLALLAVTASLLAGTLLLARDYFRQLRLGQLRTAFVGNVSHELKTPLAAIRLSAERLRYKQDSASPDERALYNVIGWETERLKHMVDSVLEVSRIDRGERRYDFTSDDLAGTVGRIIDTYEGYCQSKGFEVHAKLESNLPRIWHDPEATSEAIINLLENAVKFSESNRRIDLRLCAKGDWVIFEVRDYGIGVPRFEQSKIFDEFYRASNATNKPGCGIGLYLVRMIMSAHQGTVEVDSPAGAGSRFRIKFPLWPRS